LVRSDIDDTRSFVDQAPQNFKLVLAYCAEVMEAKTRKVMEGMGKDMTENP
jgi:hypothetical protein